MNPESSACPIPNCFDTPFTHERIKNPLGLCARHLIDRYDEDREFLAQAVAGRNALLVEAKEEIRKLHEECDRLTAIIGQNK